MVPDKKVTKGEAKAKTSQSRVDKTGSSIFCVDDFGEAATRFFAQGATISDFSQADCQGQG